VTDATIQVEISGLADLGLVALRSRWLGLYGSEAPARMSRELLVQAIAYRVQENAFGGLSSVIRARMTDVLGAKRIERTRIDRSVKAGTRFVRACGKFGRRRKRGDHRAESGETGPGESGVSSWRFAKARNTRSFLRSARKTDWLGD
jgi:hypothetical protein